MNKFVKYILASAIGVFVAFFAMGALSIISLIGMAASTSTTVTPEDNSVLVLQLDGSITERVEEDIMAQITGQSAPALGLKEMMEAIDKAKGNDDIKGIYIESGAPAFDAPATAQALRNKLEEFQKNGKWIVAYADTYTQYGYYVSSIADEVYVNPKGMIDWHGLAANQMFFKDMLAKFGVKVQLTKVGKYKSAPEMLTADKMSEPNREQMKAYIDGTWKEMLADVAESRELSAETLNAYADSMVMFTNPDRYVAMKLADKLIYTDEVKGEIKARLGIDADDDINQLFLADMANVKAKDDDADDRIAIYYAYGDVVDTKATGMNAAPCIAGDVVCKDLEKLANDDDIKAVVLRINTGGGSAYASEQIWHSMMKLKEKKPVVVSMGGYAASGGYYISCPANYIYAEPTTLTGSIGIFGMFPDMSNLLTEKLGIKFDEIKTNKHSAFGTMARPFNADEMAILNTYIGRGYELFRQRVADGRGMTVEQVEEIAQGRVWIGNDALGIKLVDELGGLDQAITKAAALAELTEYGTDCYPAPANWMDQFLNTAMGGSSYLDGQIKEALGEYHSMFMLVKNINHHNAIQARLPYQLTIK